MNIQLLKAKTNLVRELHYIIENGRGVDLTENEHKLYDILVKDPEVIKFYEDLLKLAKKIRK